MYIFETRLKLICIASQCGQKSVFSKIYIHFQIFDIYFLIFEIPFLIFEIKFLIFKIPILIFKIRTTFKY